MIKICGKKQKKNIITYWSYNFFLIDFSRGTFDIFKAAVDESSQGQALLKKKQWKKKIIKMSWKGHV